MPIRLNTASSQNTTSKYYIVIIAAIFALFVFMPSCAKAELHGPKVADLQLGMTRDKAVSVFLDGENSESFIDQRDFVTCGDMIVTFNDNGIVETITIPLDGQGNLFTFVQKFCNENMIPIDELEILANGYRFIKSNNYYIEFFPYGTKHYAKLVNLMR